MENSETWAVGGLFGAIPAAASLSRSALQQASGGQTQVTSIISSVILLLVLLVLGPYFSVLPRASLAAIITVNLRGMFRQFNAIPDLFRFSRLASRALALYFSHIYINKVRLDTLVWLFGFGSVLSLGIELGLLSCVFALLLSNGELVTKWLMSKHLHFSATTGSNTHSTQGATGYQRVISRD